MENRLKLKWQKCPSGYALVMIDRSQFQLNVSPDGNFIGVPQDALRDPVAVRAALRWSQWILGDQGPDRIQIVEPKSTLSRACNPLKRQDLYLEFGNLGSEPKNILLFAREHGLLEQAVAQPSTIQRWYSEVSKMHSAIEDWKRTRTGELNPAEFAQNHIQELGVIGLSASLSFQRKKTPTISLEPRNLLEGMWAQFLFAIEGGIDFKNCDQCKKLFEVAPGTNRPDRKHCSDACRQRAYRQAKKQSEQSV